MTPNEPSAQPRKRSWKAWLIGLACVVAVATIALLATPPKPEPVKVWFVRATNDGGVKRLVFQATNGFPRSVVLYARVVTGAMREKRTVAELNPFYDLTIVPARTQTNCYFTLSVPEANVPYSVVWVSRDIERPTTPWGRFRMGCYGFFITHGMPSLARRLTPPPELHYIPSTEIKE